MMLNVCEAMRDHTKDLINANTLAWKIGHEPKQIVAVERVDILPRMLR